MGHIKCRYDEAYCNRDYRGKCSYGYDVYAQQECENYSDRYTDLRGWVIISEYCQFCVLLPCAFEKDSKSYEFGPQGLKIGRKEIDGDLINYLEIDGEVFIDREDAPSVNTSKEDGYEGTT